VLAADKQIDLAWPPRCSFSQVFLESGGSTEENKKNLRKGEGKKKRKRSDPRTRSASISPHTGIHLLLCWKKREINEKKKKKGEPGRRRWPLGLYHTVQRRKKHPKNKKKSSGLTPTPSAFSPPSPPSRKY